MGQADQAAENPAENAGGGKTADYVVGEQGRVGRCRCLLPTGTVGLDAYAQCFARPTGTAIIGAITVAALYFGREVFVPAALAILLSLYWRRSFCCGASVSGAFHRFWRDLLAHAKPSICSVPMKIRPQCDKPTRPGNLYGAKGRPQNCHG
jgi:hypothetical protein